MSRRAHIDWEAARAYWLDGYPDITYSTVGRRFGVSDTAVGLHARKHNWKAAALDMVAAEKAANDKRIARSRDERNQRVRLLVDKWIDEMEEKSGQVKPADLPPLLRHLELVEGEPTDRVTFDELQTTIRLLLSVAVETARIVAESRSVGEAEVFVQEFREVLMIESGKAIGE